HATTRLEDRVRVERILQPAHEQEPGAAAPTPGLATRAQTIRPTLHTRAPTADPRVGEEAVRSGHQHVVVAAHLDANDAARRVRDEAREALEPHRRFGERG